VTAGYKRPATGVGGRHVQFLEARLPMAITANLSVTLNDQGSEYFNDGIAERISLDILLEWHYSRTRPAEM